MVATGAASLGVVPRKGLIAVTTDRVVFIAGVGGMIASVVWAVDRSDTWADQHKDRFYWLLTIRGGDGPAKEVRVFSEPAAERIVSELPPPDAPAG